MLGICWQIPRDLADELGDFVLAEQSFQAVVAAPVRFSIVLKAKTYNFYSMKIYAGTSGFAYKEWKGRFYPKDLPAAQMLRFYGEHFPAVEINATFYRLPKPEAVATWAKEVPDNFKFAVKAPQQITHRREPANAPATMKELMGAVGALRERLGPLLFQLPPWTKKDAARLNSLLGLVPRGQRAAFEFRHASWFDEEIYDLLRRHKAALCIAEAEDDFPVPFVSTADWGYLRLRRLDYKDAQLKAWTGRVRSQNWKETFIFFRHEDTARGPAFAQKFLGSCQARPK
jgi:uncharacterized protein YecE (DUF72 family)